VDEEIRKMIERFDGLIDEEAADMLVREKRGELKWKKIEELEEGKAWLYAKVENVVEKNITMAVVGDETGHCILKIWEGDYGIKEGDVIKIVNAWVKNGMRGREINVGKYGKIEKADVKIETKIEFGIKKGLFNIRGKINRIYPTQVYLGNKERFIRKVVVDGHEIFLMNERAREMKKFSENDEIIILWLHERNGRIYGDEVSKIHAGEMRYDAE